MPALLPTLDLRDAMSAVSRSGAAFVSEALDPNFCRILQSEVEDVRYERLPDETGPYRVREEADLFRITEANLSDFPEVAQLRSELVRLIRAHGQDIEGLDRWLPNDVAIMRYERGSIGVSPHRDGKRNRYLVAIVTSNGAATLAHCADREGSVISEWETTPGSLALLRGPRLGGAEDDRPFHAVRGPSAGQRTSVTFRMNANRHLANS